MPRVKSKNLNHEKVSLDLNPKKFNIFSKNKKRITEEKSSSVFSRVNASLVSRVLATSVDYLILIFIFTFLDSQLIKNQIYIDEFLEYLGHFLPVSPYGQLLGFEYWEEFIAFILWLPFCFLIYILPLQKKHKSFGKIIFKIRIIDFYDRYLSFNQIIFREFIFKPIFILVPFLWPIVLLNDDRRALHDYVSSTQVVDQ